MPAEITINDVAFVPEVVEGWVSEDLRKKSNILNSAAVVPGFQGIPLHGYKVGLPAWAGIAGRAQSAGSCLTPRGMDSNLQLAQIQRAGVALSVSGLVPDVAGTDPFQYLTEKLYTFWNREIQATLVDATIGATAAMESASGAGTIIVDGSSSSISFGGIVAARSKFGEYADQATMLIIHPDVYATLLANEATQFRPGQGVVPFDTYAGMQVVVDSSVPVSGSGSNAVYTSYIAQVGAYRYGELNLGSKALEGDRDILCDEDVVTSRKTFIIHPFGGSFTGTPADPFFATGAELRNSANWAVGLDDPQSYRIRALTARL